MIKDHCFTKGWLDQLTLLGAELRGIIDPFFILFVLAYPRSKAAGNARAGFKKQTDHRRIDKIVLEKMIFALHLLELLKVNGLDFVFKGGTSLVLLIETGNRFSIDIDIISKTNQEDLETILNNIIDTSSFTEWKLDEHRSYQPGVPKAHYKLSFDTIFRGSGSILLDVLIEDPAWIYLNRLKRLPDKSGFFYWYKVVDLQWSGVKPCLWGTGDWVPWYSEGPKRRSSSSTRRHCGPVSHTTTLTRERTAI
jgi:hypothetical protein